MHAWSAIEYIDLGVSLDTSTVSDIWIVALLILSVSHTVFLDHRLVLVDFQEGAVYHVGVNAVLVDELIPVEHDVMLLWQSGQFATTDPCCAAGARIVVTPYEVVIERADGDRAGFQAMVVSDAFI